MKPSGLEWLVKQKTGIGVLFMQTLKPPAIPLLILCMQTNVVAELTLVRSLTKET